MTTGFVLVFGGFSDFLLHMEHGDLYEGSHLRHIRMRLLLLGVFCNVFLV